MIVKILCPMPIIPAGAIECFCRCNV